MVNNDQFHTTHWSVVLTAKGDDTAAREALSTLCETYYQPVLRYVERQTATDSMRRYGGRDARDLTHDFFTQLLEGRMFAQLHREGARFRVYLLGTVRLFLSQMRIRESAQKRGGEISRTALPEDVPEDSRHRAAFDAAVFDRDWARAMIRRATDSLQKTERPSENGDSTNTLPMNVPPGSATPKLLPWLICELNAETRRRLAAELDMTETAVKVALHRLRKRFRETIRRQIAETVAHESEIDAELDHLIRALRENGNV